MEPTFDKAGYDQLTAIEQRLKRTYPDVGLSLGYVGNLSTWGDDRAWKFFTKVAKPHGTQAYAYEQFSWGYATSANLTALAEKAEAGLEDWLKITVMPESANCWRSFRIVGRDIRFRRTELERMGFQYGSDGQDRCEVAILGKKLEEVRAMLGDRCEVTEVPY